MFIGVQTSWQHSATSLYQLLMLLFSSRIVVGHCSLAWWKGEHLLPSCSLRLDSQQYFFCCCLILFLICFVLFLYLKPWLFSGKCLPVLILNPLSFQEMTGRVHILITMVYPKLLHLWETLGFEAGSDYSWSISSLLRVNSYPETSVLLQWGWSRSCYNQQLQSLSSFTQSRFIPHSCCMFIIGWEWKEESSVFYLGLARGRPYHLESVSQCGRG